MSQHLPVAPAKVRALVLPIGQIKRDRFQTFVHRLNEENVVQLGDITADGRPNRNMFSPLAFPNGAIFYDLITYIPPPSHLALAPFDLFREPLAVIAIADGRELDNVAFSKRQSANGYAPTMAGRNIRTLYQELEELRDVYPKMVAHHVLIFDFKDSAEHPISLPEGIKAIPPLENSKRTTVKTVMCDISSLLLAEMTHLAKSFEALTAIDSPGQAPARPGMHAWTSDDAANPMARRNSQFAVSTVARSASTSGAADSKNQNRMSMPAFKQMNFGSNSSTPAARPTTPVRSGLSNPPTTFDDMVNAQSNGSDVTSPEHKNGHRPVTSEDTTKSSKVSVQGFGPGGLNEKWRNKGKGRASILVASLFLQAGRWTDSLKELIEGATVAKSINDHLWHGKALELIVVNLLLLGWAGIEFQVPTICLPPNEKSTSKQQASGETDADQPKHLRNFQVILPDLLERIMSLYSRISGEQLPPLPLSETIIRFCNILSAIHLCRGKLDKQCLEMMIFGRDPASTPLTTSPRLTITPSRGHIVTLLLKALPSSAPELLTTVDRSIILSGIATILEDIGYRRKKALVLRELVSVLIGGLIEARTRGAAEVGIHPAAGLMAMNALNGHGGGTSALELGEGDLEHGIEDFLGLLCKTYGVVGFTNRGDDSRAESPSESGDADEDVIARIHQQSSSRHFGFNQAKLSILRSCIHFSEALPDFQGVLKYSSDLLRTAGSGVAPGPRQEDAAPTISRDEQVRLVTNISKTSSLSQNLGLGQISAEYWDEFLIRGITLDPLPMTRSPTPHSKNVLPGVVTARTSQDVNPFIYNPFVRNTTKAKAEQTLVSGEAANFRITIQNPFEIDLEIESIKLHAEGAEFEPSVLSTVIGPYRTQILKIQGTPRSAGSLKINGAVVQVRGCRERRFPIFSQPWTPELELKVKGIGLGALKQHQILPPPGPPLKPENIDLSVIPAQPVIIIKSCTLSQSSIMLLEGERRVFSVTLQNISPTTPADLLLFSFQDSTQAPLQSAMANRDATAAELHEFEWVLAKKQALRLRKIDDSKRYIAPASTAIFEFEILGKPGLTDGTIQIDYAHLGMPQSEITSQFFTRQVCLDLAITVNAGVELARADLLPISSDLPGPLWNHKDPKGSMRPSPEDHCLLLMDLRNAWPVDMQISLHAGPNITVEEHILPGNTNRIILPISRFYLKDPHASIPALNPSRQRQFVVSSSKITPDIERGNREAFWYREKILENLSGTWKTATGAPREGTIELRSLRLSQRMIEAVKIDEVGIKVSVEDPDSTEQSPNRMCVDDFVQLKVEVENRTDEPIYPTLRLLPSLCNRPVNVALDFTRKFAWNGALQQALPLLDARASTEVRIGVTALCRGDFEISASVEETQLWKDPAASKRKDKEDDGADRKGRERSDTQTMLDAVLGAKERRMWHTRRPCVVSVRDRPEE